MVPFISSFVDGIGRVCGRVLRAVQFLMPPLCSGSGPASRIPAGKRRVTLQLEMLECREVPAALVPVLIVPGYLASVPSNDALVTGSFFRQLSYPPQQLHILQSAYGGLETTLENAGYQLGKTLFEAPYDWRMPAAPLQLGNNPTPVFPTGPDQVYGLQAHWLQPNNFQYAVDYLRYWLTQVEQVNPGTTQVDVISHSTGGPLVRAYIQSDAYGGMAEVTPGNSIQLPTIRNFVMGAAPTEGAVLAWNAWNGNFSDGPSTLFFGRFLLTKVQNVYDSVAAGKLVLPDPNAPNGEISLASISDPDPFIQQRNFNQQYNALLQTLNPTYNFIITPGSSQLSNITDQPQNRSDLLLALNSQSSPGVNPWTAKIGHLTVVFDTEADNLNEGVVEPYDSVQTAYLVQEHIGAGGQVLPLTGITLYQSNLGFEPTVPGQVWYTQISGPLEGDGVIPLESGQATFFDASGNPDPNITVQQFGSDPAPTGQTPQTTWAQLIGRLDHSYMFTNELLNQYTLQAISTNSNTSIATGLTITKVQSLPFAIRLTVSFTGPGESGAVVAWGPRPLPGSPLTQKVQSVNITNGSATITIPIITGGVYQVQAYVRDPFTGQLVYSSPGTVRVVSLIATGPLISSYVTNLYQQLLGRAPDLAGGQYWDNLLNQGVSPVTVVQGIESSTEYLDNQVATYYEEYLQRVPDPAGEVAWISFLQSGGTLEQVQAGILSSPEYFQLQGGSNQGFVDALYEDVLGRDADPAGEQAWLQALASGASRTAVAGGFLTSTEYLDDLVGSYYQQFLNRAADAGGLAYWAQQLASGVTDQAVLAGIAGSDEAYSLA